MNTPKHASDTQINRLFDLASSITRDHAAALAADPGLAARLDGNPDAVVAHCNDLLEPYTQPIPVAVKTSHRDLPMRIQVDPDVLVVELVEALAFSGLTLRSNPETGVLWLTKVTR